jgi:hypothetical protein
MDDVLNAVFMRHVAPTYNVRVSFVAAWTE